MLNHKPIYVLTHETSYLNNSNPIPVLGNLADSDDFYFKNSDGSIILQSLESNIDKE